MAPGMMNADDNPNVSQWSLEAGYEYESNGTEYPIRNLNVGTDTGLVLTFYFNDSDLELWCKDMVLGYRVILSVPGDELKMSEQQNLAPLDSDTQILLKPKMVTTSEGLQNYEPNQRKCFYSSERQLRFYRNYTQNNCEAECLANFTNIECGCVKFSMPSKQIGNISLFESHLLLVRCFVGDSNTKICGPMKMNCYLLAKSKLFQGDINSALDATESFRMKCNCLPTCTSVQYDRSISELEIDRFLHFINLNHSNNV